MSVKKRLSFTAKLFRSFSGYADENDWWEHLYMLHDDMVRNDVNMETIDLTSFITAGYDSPFHLINRRNEVWMFKTTK